MRAYLTGGAGFVGGWLSGHLRACGDEVVLIDEGIDVNDADALASSLIEAAPDVVYHLAALTHVGQSWQAPKATFEVNVLGTLNLLEVARRLEPMPSVLLVSSAEVYGSGMGVALDERAPLVPVSPYAASKVAAEFVGVQAFAGYGLKVLRARPFNHVGPGQSDAFVVSGLAKRVAAAERLGGGEVRVGNLTPQRDFTDVRDVVRAYRMLVTDGEPGEAYNICSGRALSIATVLETLVSLARCPIEIVADPELSRPVDVQVLVGDATKLSDLCGWAPSIPLEETLADVLETWRGVLAGSEAAS